MAENRATPRRGCRGEEEKGGDEVGCGNENSGGKKVMNGDGEDGWGMVVVIVETH